MKTFRLCQWAALGLALPLFVGCVERQVVYRDAPVQTPPVVEQAPLPPPPPPPQTEYVTVAPGPLDAWFWAPGCWEWRGRWVWTGGHWIARPHPGAVWVGAHWDRHGGRRVWIHGGWR